MHPAFSVIIFTTITGLGYGIANIVFLNALWGRWNEFNIFLIFISYCFVALGLCASLFHLGHINRAWRALSQWRSSWLSREGILSLLSFIPPFFIIFFANADIFILSLLGLIINFSVIFATAMIYASLKPIQAWHNPLVPILFQLVSLISGYLAIAALTHQYDTRIFWGILLSMAIFSLYWYIIAREPAISTIGSATGLGKLGKVRAMDSPHDGANYLQKEMGFKIMRQHAQSCKLVILGLWFWAIMAVHIHDYGIIIGFFAYFSGVFLSRWLFFAEAKHVVNLYYPS